MKQLQEVLTKQDKKHITLCPTNLAALLVGGMTIHKFLTKLKKQSQVENLDLDYIFIDEVLMLGEVFYKFLMMIKKIRPDIKFIISGDYNQLNQLMIGSQYILIILILLVCLNLQIITKYN